MAVALAAMYGLCVETWLKVYAYAMMVFIMDTTAILVDSFAHQLRLAHFHFAAKGRPLGFGGPFLKSERFYFHIKLNRD